jgi:hypothetical protein
MAFKIQDVGGFGTGALGDVTISSASTQVNSYANATAISALGYQVAIGAPSVGAFGGFTAGQEILFHATGCLTAETTDMGKNGYATILAVTGNTLSLDKPIPIVDLAKYVCQAVTMPQFNNLTVNCRIDALKYDVANKYGGILIAKVKGLFDLSNGMWITEGKGLPNGSSLKPAGITLQNSDLVNRLVMSTGNGIAIIIANNFKGNINSRIGATWSGSLGAGVGGHGTYSGLNDNGTNGTTTAGGDGGSSGAVPKGGISGYSGANGSGYAAGTGGFAGAVIFLCINNIVDFMLDWLSTGGQCGINYEVVNNGSNSGAGYGGGGAGDNQFSGTGGAGGGPGRAFIATNTASFTTNTVAYVLDTLIINKRGLLISNVALDCTASTSVDGFEISGVQPANTDRRVVFKTNIATVAGSRTYPITTNTVAGDTITINGITFTAVASGATGNQFNIGATTTITTTNLTTTLNANTTINTLYTATSSANTLILTEKMVGGGNTPSTATKTGTIVIGAGTVTTSVPAWYKISGTGSVALTAVATQTLTVDSVLAEGNTVAELLAATSIPGFIGKLVSPVIALSAPGEAVVWPTLRIGIKDKNSIDQTTKEVISPLFPLSIDAVEIIDLTAVVTVSSGASAVVTVALQQNGVLSDYMPLASARRQKATAYQLKATYTVPVVGTGSAKVEKVTAQYRSNDAVVSGDTAEIVSITKDFSGVGMRFGRIMVKHQPLKDATLRALMSMRPIPQTREKNPVTVGNGQRQTVKLGINSVADTGINHNTVRLYHGGQEVFDFDFNTEMSEVSTTAPDGTTVFASYSYGWDSETWQEMSRGTTQAYDNSGMDGTEFTYVLPSSETPKGVAAVKIVLEKPGGHIDNEFLAMATGKTQMLVLPHSAKKASIVLTASTGTASFAYDDVSRILTFVATQDTELHISYDWIAETPVCTGWVACWNE